MRILLVEDNVQLGDAVREQMVSDGHATDHMLTLQHAQARLSTTSYDLILLDMMLPDGKGLGLLQKSGRRTVQPRSSFSRPWIRSRIASPV